MAADKEITTQLLHHQQQQLQHQMSFGMMQSTPSSSSSVPQNFISKENNGVYDLGELDQALFLYLDSGQETPNVHHHHQDQRQNAGMMRPPTLNIFPSRPMHVDPSTQVNTGMVSPSTSVPRRQSEHSMELGDPKNDVSTGPEPAKPIKREGNRKGSTSGSSELEGPKTPDPKTLRRLAQNREAARKSRLRKKAYVQQLETSRMRLNELEQELQRARAQGMFIGGAAVGGDQGLPVGGSNISTEAAAMFDIEYARWLEEHHRRTCELQAAVQEHLPESDLRLFVDNCLAHFDEAMNLRAMLAKSDIFHLVSGVWMTPAERCFLWIGGFRAHQDGIKSYRATDGATGDGDMRAAAVDAGGGGGADSRAGSAQSLPLGHHRL
ncbi:hypothetical protein BT93_K1234 [Corymbia citriodora subsp. variegata]|nr:hypothetical protein BT93_K1234 [Corymbia citriodora subsp. variegata]